MTTILDGGSASDEKGYIGLPGELRKDTSNQDLLLHDGSTPGGKRFLNLTRADARYQAHSDELDGLEGFKPEARGLLVRLGAANYIIRSITATSGEVVLTNGDFQDGGMDIALPDIIPGDRGIDGDLSVTGNAGIGGYAEASGGFRGALTGNVDGDLTGDSAGTHTGPQVGNVDVRGHTLLLDDDQISMAKIAGLADALANTQLPIGMIMMWGGATNAIPDHWALCDGTNGTPNLAGNFIVAADAGTQNETGGSETHTHTVTIDESGDHTHNIDIAGTALSLNQVPQHNHGAGMSFVGGQTFVFASKAGAPTLGSANVNYQTGVSGSVQPVTESVGGHVGGATAGQTDTHTHAGSSESAGGHTHSTEVGTGSNIPPYYALAFIMKVS